jgi:hypothetical protein
MREKMMALGTILWLASGSSAHAADRSGPPDGAGRSASGPPAAVTPARPAIPARQLFLDVHELGRGKVTAEAVAGAHQRDLAAEGKHGVAFKAYWVDAKEGKIYCLAEAPTRAAVNAVHKEAHGLVATRIMPVTADNMTWAPTPGAKLYFDVHHLGPGKVTASAVAEAHKKDLAVGPRHDVRYINYWLDEQAGDIMCLAEAPSAEAAVAVHREAHGLVADSIEQVIEGR